MIQEIGKVKKKNVVSSWYILSLKINVLQIIVIMLTKII